jgi:hypothetical protein
MYLVVFIFVLCLLFIFFVTVVAVFQMRRFAAHDGDEEHILSLS